MQGNKGEWSESYAALRIIGDRKIFVADRSGAMNPNEWMNVLALMRRETRERLVSYRYDANDVDVVIAVNEDPVYRCRPRNLCRSPTGFSRKSTGTRVRRLS